MAWRIGAMAMALGVALLASGPAEAALALHRGVGLHQWLNWAPLDPDGSYRWPPYRSVDEWLGEDRPASDWPAGDPFARIKALGFDFVRLTVDPGPLLASSGAKRQEALDVLSADVKKLTAVGLKVVFDLHGVTQVPAYSMDVVNAPADSASVAGYRDMVAEVAKILVPIGADKVALEPFNEPAHYPCDSTGDGDWQKIMAGQVAAIRAVSPELTIIATGACGGDVIGLVDIDPSFDDANIYYSFHMYEPHLFTHQRSDTKGAFASGLPWPASSGTAQAVVAQLQAYMDIAGLTAAEQQANLDAVHEYIEQYFTEGWGQTQLDQRFAQVTDWAKAHNIPNNRLFMGEFGAILMSADGRSGANDADRLRYLTAVRKAAEAAEIPWAIWEYSNPYGMTVIEPSGPAVPDAELLGALGLGQ